MKIQDYTKEMVDEKSFIDMAYTLLHDKGSTMNLYDIIDEFKSLTSAFWMKVNVKIPWVDIEYVVCFPKVVIVVASISPSKNSSTRFNLFTHIPCHRPIVVPSVVIDAGIIAIISPYFQSQVFNSAIISHIFVL